MVSHTRLETIEEKAALHANPASVYERRIFNETPLTNMMAA
jgi:hypothetical protein